MMVFDSSALLAFARDENGAEYVGELLAEADVAKYIHAANLCEIYHQSYRYIEEQGLDGKSGAEEMLHDVQIAGIATRTDLDIAFWKDAGELIAKRRLAGASLPLGDALGVALARRLEAEFVTADRAEIEPLEREGLVSVIFIR